MCTARTAKFKTYSKECFIAELTVLYSYIIHFWFEFLEGPDIGWGVGVLIIHLKGWLVPLDIFNLKESREIRYPENKTFLKKWKGKYCIEILKYLIWMH